MTMRAKMDDGKEKENGAKAPASVKPIHVISLGAGVQSSTMTLMAATENDPETLLRALLKEGFYYGVGYKGIQWGYVEGTSIADILGPEFEEKIRAYMPKEL